MQAQEMNPEKSAVLARIGDNIITEKQVKDEAAVALENLKLQRLRFETEQAEGEYQIIQRQLDEMVKDRLLALEASERGISKKQLLAAEVSSKISQPSEEAVNRFYEANRKRLRGTKEKVLPQIRRHLQQQQEKQAQQTFLGQLKEKYQVDYALKPFRVEVATDGSPSLGPEDARVKIVEFSDFQCPYCSKLIPILKQAQKNYPDEVRLVFRQFPLKSIHPHAQKAAEASLCARDQGKFWEMHDLLFKGQNALGIKDLKVKAEQLGLDGAGFKRCLESGKSEDEVTKDLLAGARAGVKGTPCLFVNGRRLVGAASYQQISDLIEDELKR
jgi:protein-disulfide isomerase